MNQNEVPIGPRFQFAAELRAARSRVGLTAKDVADRLKCTAATVRRWERGGTGLPRYGELLMMLDMYRITDPDQRGLFEELRGQADQDYWWSRFHVPDVTSQMHGFEAFADEIWIYERSLVPGLLQTEAYASAVIAGLDQDIDDVDEDAVRQRVQRRLARQARVLKSHRPPKLRVLLDEDAVFRPAAPRDVMREQLRFLSHGPYAHELRVITQHAGLHHGSPGSFWVYRFPSDVRRDAVYSEGPIRSLFEDEPEQVKRAKTTFETLWDLALSRGRTIDLIQRRTEELNSHSPEPDSAGP